MEVFVALLIQVLVSIWLMIAFSLIMKKPLPAFISKNALKFVMIGVIFGIISSIGTKMPEPTSTTMFNLSLILNILACSAVNFNKFEFTGGRFSIFKAIVPKSETKAE